jgi:prevent-host-death family protein
MTVWQVQEARKRLSAVMEEAVRTGPQVITRGGVERVVVVSAEEYRRLTAHQPNLREYLLGGPKVDGFEAVRERDLGRKVGL